MKRFFAAIELLIFYMKEVFVSNMKIAFDVVTPHLHSCPQIFTIELDERLTDVQVTVLSNLITMTPGTLSIDVSENCKELIIHSMYIENSEELYEVVKRQYERRVLNVF